MSSFRIPAPARATALVLLTALFAACDGDPPTRPDEVTTVFVSVSRPSIAQGDTGSVIATAADQDGEPIDMGAVTWTTSSATIATVSPTGAITGVGPGTAEIVATAPNGISGRQNVTIVAPAGIRITEVESNGGTPGDWVELYNPTAAAVDISGWIFRDNDPTHTYRLPAGTSIPSRGYLVLEEAAFGFGLGGAEEARLFSPFEVLVDSHSWTAHAAVTYGRCPDPAGAFVPNLTSTKGAANDCRPPVVVNEVESNGGTPGDWIELYNNGTAAVDLSGFVVKDSEDGRTTALAAGTMIAPGGFLVIEESTLGYGLGGADAARLFNPAGQLVDSYEWTAHAALTYGRCPDGTGAFAATTASTKGTANTCTPVGPVTSPWPGANDVTEVDPAALVTSNLSGLTYEGAGGGSPAVLWAVVNGPGTLHRLVLTGGLWTPDAANSWGNGKALRYTDGTGNPDSEGVTYAGGGSAGGDLRGHGAQQRREHHQPERGAAL